jgi:ArsR family transcriptional regulator, arsenate/arsenite/antimonite-responsive transcriptional repressor / arsenate reductase (thioredoxin)
MPSPSSQRPSAPFTPASLTQRGLTLIVACVDRRIERQAAVHAALGEPVRLAIVEQLAVSDRAPSALSAQFGLTGNLLAHHLDVLERVGLITRQVSTGDRRRRYVRLNRHLLGDLAVGTRGSPGGRAVFVCTKNSARSQLAAALWRKRTGDDATSAGTHPADRVHPGAVAAARRAGLDLGDSAPRALEAADLEASLIVTVCDRAREELEPPTEWLHWSIPDPVDSGTRRAFDAALAELDHRIAAITTRDPEPTGRQT